MHFLHKYAPRGKDKKAKTWLLARHLCFGLQSSEKNSNYHNKSTIIIRRRRQKVEKRLNLPTILFFGPRILFFAHESHEFSCKRAQNRTCSSFAERSRKCQEIYTNLFVLCIKGDLYGRTNHTNSMILFEMLLR